ncbi:hypothetical protein AYY18_14325 [Morganella psychrotolerans]|uniref:Uncharacterized protein n=1 Tax=Morganella psychrotolerans TaxID=368603 RepID=A0A1B8HTB4_9GAMM|nr:hypothetical protein AYY18_14325 [Morganella psychrotolerans]
MFTDITAAIEEARFSNLKWGFDYAVIQASWGMMKVVTHFRAESMKKCSVMFTTRNDKYHTVQVQS